MSTTNIHPTAIVSPEAELSDSVSIGPYAIVGPRVILGKSSTVGPHAVIHAMTEVGPGTRIHAHAVIGDTPQDLAFKEADTFVKIGANCVIREGVTIQRGTKPETATVTGDNCYLMAYAHLAHNVELGNHVILANNVMLAGYVSVGDNVFMGGGAGIHQFCKIGRLAMIGGNGSFSKDVPPFCMTATGGFNSISGLNVVGLRRSGMNPQVRQEVKRAFTLLFLSGLNVSQAVDRIRSDFKEGPALEFVEFVENSDRGICSARAIGREEKS